MEKRIDNIFDYNSYNLVLHADFAKRSALNPSYSLRSYARDLDISLGYLSEVFNGKRHFSEAKGRTVFTNMGFEDNELLYLEGLVALSHCKTPEEVLKAKQYCRKFGSNTGFKFDHDPTNDEILNSVDHFLVFALARKITTLEEICQITDQFSIRQSRVKDILDEFIEKEYISFKNDEYIVNDPNTIIGDHRNYCEFLHDFSQFFNHHYKVQNKNTLPDNVASGLILSMDEHTIQEIRDLNSYYIVTLLKISNRVKEPTHFGFMTNLWMEKELKPTIH